jgi:hypothetical protein
MENYVYMLYNLLFLVMGKIEQAAKEAFVATLVFAEKIAVKSDIVNGFHLDFELDDNGLAIPPDEDDLGTQVSLVAGKVRVSEAGGFIAWLKRAKDIPCNCKGENEECPRCGLGIDEGSHRGTAKDRYAIKQPALPVEKERTTIMAILLDQIRNIIKDDVGYNYMVFCPKGNTTMYLCTMSSMEELAGDGSDGKLLKRLGYFTGYNLYTNNSESKLVRVAILKEEEWFNGQLMWNVMMGLKLAAHAIRLLKDTIVKGSARSVCYIENEWGKKLFGIVGDDICGIGTHELIKRVAKSDIIRDCGHYYVLEFNVKDLIIVNPPLNKGLPGLGLSLWKYGGFGKILNKLVTGGFFQSCAIRHLSEAMSGNYDHQAHVLGTKLPKQGEESYRSSFSFAVPVIEQGVFSWRNPKDEKSWRDMWKRFYSYLLFKIQRIDLNGFKGIVASCSIVIDAYQEMYDLTYLNDRKIFCVMPDEKVFTDLGKISMEEACMDSDKGFLFAKDPMSSIRQVVTITPIGCKSLLHFLLFGTVVLYLDDQPVLTGKGSIIVPSKLMQEIMCIQDFDGDQPKVFWVEKEFLLPVPAPVDWVAEFVPKEKGNSKKVNLQTEQEKLEYYSDLMLTIVAARQAIAPMVLGSLAGYIELVIRAYNDGRLLKFPLEGWDKIQRLLSAIAEIYAIKKEKSMADSEDKKDGWLWVDMFLDLYNEAKSMIPEFRETRKMEKKMAAAIRGIIRPIGELAVENEETGEVDLLKSSDPYYILKTLVSKVKMVATLPQGIKDYFPSLELTAGLGNVVLMRPSKQSPKPGAECIADMTSDVQKQQAVFKRMLDYYLHSADMSRFSGVFIELDQAAAAFVKEVRQGVVDVINEFPEGDESLERTEMIRENQTWALDILTDLGLCERHATKEWVAGKGLDSDREYLFAMLVGIKDMAYYHAPDGDGGKKVKDGKKSSFNKCTAEGVRRCILGYYATVEAMSVDDFLNNGDTRRIGSLEGFHLPHWLHTEEIEFFDVDGFDTEELI